jgi:WD40 repeat protein
MKNQNRIMPVFFVILIIAGVLAGCGTPASPLVTSAPEESIVPTATGIEIPVISVNTVDDLAEAESINLAGALDFIWCGNGTALCVAYPDKIAIYNLTMGQITEETASKNPRQLTLSPDQSKLAWVAEENLVVVWNQQGSSAVQSVPEAQPVIDMEFTPDSQSLVVSSGDERIQNLGENGEQGDSPVNYPGWLVNLAYSPDGSLFAGTSQEDFATILFDAQTGAEQKQLIWSEHASPVLYGAYFSPDWETLAWVTRGTIQLMNVETGEMGFMLGHEDFVVSTDWSPAGDLLASAAAGTTNGIFSPLVYLWDPETGQTVDTLVSQEPVLRVEFSPDGRTLAVLDAQGAMHLWQIPH